MEITAILTYDTKGHIHPCGQTVGANGAGQFAIVYYCSIEEASRDANQRIKSLEKAGHKVESIHFIENGMNFGGHTIKQVGS